MSDKIVKYDDVVVYENGAWVDSVYKDISITGGEDVTNTTLINTLAANAEGGIKMPKTKTEALEALNKNPQEYAATIAGQLERIEDSKIVIVSKVNELGLNTESDITIDDAALAINEIVLRSDDLTLETNKMSLPEGYYKGVDILLGDVSEEYELQERTVTPTKGEQIIQPEDGFYGLSKVTVDAIPAAYQDVTSVTATADKVLVGSKFVDANGQVVDGAMANNGKVEKTLDVNNTSFAIAEGFHNGEGSVKIELEEKSVNAIDLINTTVVEPTEGSVLSKVTIVGAGASEITVDEASPIVNEDGTYSWGVNVTAGIVSETGVHYGAKVNKAVVTPTDLSLNAETGLVSGKVVTGKGYNPEAVETPLSLQLDVKGDADVTSAASGKTVNTVVPAGYYAAEVSKSVNVQDGSLTVGEISFDEVNKELKINVTATEGYILSGDHSKAMSPVALDADLVAANIRKGSEILGVEGTFSGSDTVSAGQEAASASNILTGKSAFLNGEELKGTMANIGAEEIVLSASKLSAPISQGYHDGTGTASITLGEAVNVSNNLLDSGADGAVLYASTSPVVVSGAEVKVDNTIYNRLAAI